MQDLVCPGAPDSRQHALVAQEAVQAPPLSLADAGQRGRLKPERVRPEMGKLLLGQLRCEQPDAGPLALAGLGQDQPGSTGEAELEGLRRRAALAGREQAQTPGAHQVHHQHQLSVVGGKEQALTASPGTGQAAALERLKRRLGRFQRRQMGRAGMLDRRGGDQLVERAAKRFDLRQLGQFLFASLACLPC